jgi:hypothetical protein
MNIYLSMMFPESPQSSRTGFPFTPVIRTGNISQRERPAIDFDQKNPLIDFCEIDSSYR